MKGILKLALLLLLLPSTAHAALIYYNLVGKITSVADPFNILSLGRSVSTGDAFQAIYTIDPDALLVSGTVGSSRPRISQYFSAIKNFSFYVNGHQFVDSDYRLQQLDIASGFYNGRPADYINITTTGGIDNYNDTYGQNSFGEYINNYLRLDDLQGLALDAYNTNFQDNIPLTFDLDDFESRFISIIGRVNNDPRSQNYQLRGDIQQFSTNNKIFSVLAPSSLLLLLLGLIFIVTHFKKAQRYANSFLSDHKSDILCS